MDESDSKYLETRLNFLQKEIDQLNRYRDVDEASDRARLGAIEREIASLKAQAKFQGALFGAIGGATLSLITQIVLTRI